MDTSTFPWWTLYPSLVMLSINAGVSEEAGLHGYMQGGLERRNGPVTAIIATPLLCRQNGGTFVGLSRL